VSILGFIYAAYGESTVHIGAPGGGLLQTSCNASAYSHALDWVGQIRGAYTGGECFALGGYIGAARYFRTAWQIANSVENNYVWSVRRGDSYARGGYTTAMLTAEVTNTYDYLNSTPAATTQATLTQPGPAPRPPHTGVTVGGITLPPISQRNWGPILRQIAAAYSLHGTRATGNSEWTRDLVLATDYVDEHGPWRANGLRP
jgi:hypothetical protein